jgi:2-hydroxy-6-oxonona-2,4-dienedioate hydrolase
MKLYLRSILFAAVLIAVVPLYFSQNSGLPQEKIAAVYGQNIHYFEVGQGPTVILLHGLGGAKELWLANISALGSMYHVYAIDQIGFGQSDKPLIDYKIGTFADFLRGFMQAEKIAKATLVGNSLGGWIATDFAVQHPEMVDKLVLVDAAGLAGQGPLPDLNPSTIAGWRALIELVFYDKKMVSDEGVMQAFIQHMRNNDGYTIQRTVAGFASPQFEDGRLASIHAATLVVWGRQDELILLASGEKLRDGIAGAQLLVFEHCGHVPQIEKPAEFDQALLEFLGKHVD